jgi:medium-chain acyl-[acyl-carrier-protein] hydrolase
MAQIWSETYKVPSYLVNLRGQAGLYAMVNFIQDIGWLHAIRAEIRLPKHLGWVFTRQKLVMHQWPKWNDEVEIVTWIRPPKSSLFCFRDYEIKVNDKTYGFCTSAFAVLNLETRRLANIDLKNFETYSHPTLNLNQEPEKIAMQDSALETLASFYVRNSDIDMNDHVNNSKYAQWILDALTIDSLKHGRKLVSYEINFLQEAMLGDLIHIQKAKDITSCEGQPVLVFQGTREKDGKAIFRARLGLSLAE